MTSPFPNPKLQRRLLSTRNSRDARLDHDGSKPMEFEIPASEPLNQLLWQAEQSRASDIHLLRGNQVTEVRFRSRTTRPYARAWLFPSRGETKVECWGRGDFFLRRAIVGLIRWATVYCGITSTSLTQTATPPNPAFDVTSATLITGIITPRGIFKWRDLRRNGNALG